MWTQKQFFAFNEAMHAKAVEITRIKNKDYSPGSNPFSNFEKLVNEFGEDFPQKLLAARIQEKCDRVISSVLNGHSERNNEADDNDFIDVGNYAILLLAYQRSKKDDKTKRK